MTGGVAPGWYPDYEAPPGHQRYWDGQRWTERRSTAPTGRPTGETTGRTVPVDAKRLPSVTGIVWAAVAALVAISAAVLVLGDDNPASSGSGSSPPPASTPGPPASEQGQPNPEHARRTWEVAEAVDGTTLRLTSGAEVRLAGVVDGCAPDELAKLVVGQRVTLTRRGVDKDADGRLLRYVERGDLDVGKRLIQRGWAKASDEANPRRAIYRRIDDRSPDAC